MRKRICKKITGVALTCMLLAGLTACGGKQEEEVQGESTETESTGTVLVETPGELEVVAKLGTAEVTTEGEFLYFTITTPEGKDVRFQGAGVTITDGKLVVEPRGTIFSLDYIGEITNIVADGEGGINYGVAYAKTESVKDRTGLYAAAPYGIPLMEEVNLDIASYKSSFLALEASGEEPLVLDRLMLEYDADAAQMTFDMLETEPEIMEILNGWAYNWDLYEGQEWNEKELLLSSMNVGYNPAEKVTAITDMTLNVDMSGSYVSGEAYQAEKEQMADMASESYDFYLVLKPDTEIADMTDPEASIFFVPNTFYKIGDLKDADGKVLDKKTAKVYPGTTLDITVGDYTIAMELPVQAMYAGASSMHELLPYGTAEALGEQYTLVVPVVWSDQTDMATDENLTLYKEAMGRIIEEDGSVVDYTDTQDKHFSVSEYFDTASYGKLQVKSFMTDWYYIDRTFAEAANAQPDREYADEILAWVKKTYPELDLSQFDRDGNGYVDSMVIINAGEKQGDGYSIISYGGAIWFRESYYGDYAGTSTNPEVNAYVTVNHEFLKDGNTAVLLHEFSHNFGLIDYYDVTYSGINAVGGFDMQSDNVGDWNAYSKLAAGWMDPQVVTGLASGESVELTLTSSALTDDVILIPAAGTEYTGPFSEYIMLDMFSDDGVNIYDTKSYGLNGAAGVRISHVDALMELRTMEVESKVNSGETDSYDIGTVHYANAYTDDGKGYYNIEVIQSGGVNTFTNIKKTSTKLTADDLFYAGDTFTVEDYDEFFYEGLMDDGERFGYTISIVSIGEKEDGCPYAVVRITAQ